MHGSQTRRDILRSLAGSAGLLALPGMAFADAGGVPADVTLRIAPARIEIEPGYTVATTAYNGSVPGPLIRFREGTSAIVDIFNDTGYDELVHWHGFEVPAEVDGAEEEGSLVVQPQGHLRYRLTPQPAGSRYVHTHTMSMGDLNRGTFNGQFAFAYIEPRSNPGRYDQEVFLATHEWAPYLVHSDEDEDSSPSPHPAPKKKEPKQHAFEVAYRKFTINGKCLGSGEPVRVKEGERVLFHFLNSSATESARFALPGHRFEVVALDGNPVPTPKTVDVLELGTAERVDAVVAMDSPGVWILGTPKDSHRSKGMGIVIEYAGRTGKPRWIKPPDSTWDYNRFGAARPAPKPDAVIPITISMANDKPSTFDQWLLNGKGYNAADKPIPLAKGRRNRLVFDNQSSDSHPLHIHRSSFELVSVDGVETSGVIKDVVVVKGNQKLEIDVIPPMSGLALFHCHQQIHMDYGFKLLFNFA